MLLHGLQVNVSMEGFSQEQLTGLIHKINAYLPSLIVFGFSSPFHKGELFGGLSYRIYFRARSRPLVRIKQHKGIDVIEFGGFDACGDVMLLRAQLLLFKGLLLEQSLTQKSTLQDIGKIQRSALQGLADQEICNGAATLLEAAAKALPQHERKALALLKSMLHTKDSYAVRIRRHYEKTGNIMESISGLYHY
jgi:hypothetical protein